MGGEVKDDESTGSREKIPPHPTPPPWEEMAHQYYCNTWNFRVEEIFVSPAVDW